MISTPVRKFKSGEVLFQEGDSSRSLFIIKVGVVSIRKRRAKGHIEIGLVKANEVLGELSFFDRQPRSAAAVALEDVEALEIPFEALDKIYKNVPEYMRTFISSMAVRLRKANEQIRLLQKTLP